MNSMNDVCDSLWSNKQCAKLRSQVICWSLSLFFFAWDAATTASPTSSGLIRLADRFETSAGEPVHSDSLPDVISSWDDNDHVLSFQGIWPGPDVTTVLGCSGEPGGPLAPARLSPDWPQALRRHFSHMRPDLSSSKAFMFRFMSRHQNYTQKFSRDLCLIRNSIIRCLGKDSEASVEVL